MTKWLTILGFAMIGLGLAYHFAALEIFNALVPKDAGSRLLARDVPYGPEARQTLDVYVPTTGQEPFPVVVFVHGGSWETGNKNPYTFVGRALASQGFVTLVINYRLHPDVRFPAFVDDVALALQWTGTHASIYRGDARKLFVFGHSAGAHLGAMAVLNPRYDATRPPVSGVVSLAGPHNFLPLDTAVSKRVFGWLPEAEQPITQSLTYARPDAPPFLILHGTADTTVYAKNPKGLHEALIRAGAKSTLKFYDGVTHVGILLALSRAFRGNAPVLQDSVTFMKAQLQ
jgi:acetyl esterase/lipase